MERNIDGASDEAGEGKLSQHEEGSSQNDILASEYRDSSETFRQAEVGKKSSKGRWELIMADSDARLLQGGEGKGNAKIISRR